MEEMLQYFMLDVGLVCICKVYNLLKMFFYDICVFPCITEITYYSLSTINYTSEYFLLKKKKKH